VPTPIIVAGTTLSASAVLDAMLVGDDPVVLMGNTVDEFMREMEADIADRAQQVAIQGEFVPWWRPG
jgi:hypothetical protein